MAGECVTGGAKKNLDDENDEKDNKKWTLRACKKNLSGFEHFYSKMQKK